MDNRTIAAALSILAGEPLDKKVMENLLRQKKASWYAKVTKKSWPAVRDQLLAENPKYTWPAGSPLTAFGPDQGSVIIFCKGDDTLWQGDNEDYIGSICTKREFK